MYLNNSIFEIFGLILTCTYVHSVRFPSRRTWWAKQVTADLHVTGMLTETQLKLAKESGYKTIISLYKTQIRSYIGRGESDPLPSTDETMELTQLIGLSYKKLSMQSNYTLNLDIIREFSAAFESSEKPAILYSDDGYEATFVALMHYWKASNFGVKEFFYRAGALGYSYGGDSLLVSLIEEHVGSEVNTTNTEAPVTNADWYKFPASWQIKPLYRNVYVSGQIQRNHLDSIKQAYEVVANLRRGVTVLGQPSQTSQEEVVLLNVRDRTGTYGPNRQPKRQLIQTLIANRIDPNLPPTYISSLSTVNYQARNPMQFGDDIGYNETVERLAVQQKGLKYMHIPVGGRYTYTNGIWDAYRDRLLALGTTQNILLQCRSGYRSSVIGMLLYGCLHGHNSTQALARVRLFGYDFQENTEPTVVALVRQVLDNPEVECQCRDPVICNPTTTTVTPVSKADSLLYSILTFSVTALAMFFLLMVSE